MLNKQLTVNKAPYTPRDATWEGIGLSRADIDPCIVSMDPFARGPIRIAFYVRLAVLKTHRFRGYRSVLQNLIHSESIKYQRSKSAPFAA